MADWVSSMVENYGAFGVALLMFLENVFPPIPSEVIMPLAGFSAARHGGLVAIIIAGSIGSLLGLSVWYVAARLFGEERLKRLAERHGRWLTIEPKEIDKAKDWFGRWGGWAVLVGRLVPTVRTLISVPAGLARMNPATFLLFSAIGTTAWTAALALVGAALGQRYELVEGWINPVANVVLAGIVLLYVYRVITFRRSDRPST